MGLTWVQFHKVLQDLESLSPNIIKELKANKILFFAGLINTKLQETEEWQELMRRRTLQLQALREFAETAEKIDIKYVVVKTFKLFPYVPDDVDILLLDHDKKNNLITELTAKGYSIRSIGTPEITLRKVNYSTYVDLDIHHKIAAGEYVYYPNDDLWRKRRELEIDGTKLPVASWEDECILTIAHAIMKEFKILASDILETLLCQRKGYIQLDRLRESGHLKTYRIFMRLQRQIIFKELNLPYRIPIGVVICAYINHFNHRIKKENLLPLRELMQFPKAKGIKKLLSPW
jgi:hypothetical protein